MQSLRAYWDRIEYSTLVPIFIALASGLLVSVISFGVFPYHSSNHDEGVYLMQAAMLLHGQLEISGGQLVDAFHPWFFIDDGGRLYPKYAPIPAVFYALSIGIFETPRVALGFIAAGNTYLIYRLSAMTVTRRVGIIASVVFALSPLAVITSAVFLPYAPSTFFHLLFAVAYIRSVQEDSVPAALGAGIAIGLAFFSRPFTAVLFAIPFVLHATLQLAIHVRDTRHDYVHRHLLTAIIGSGFVLLALAYNFRMTGSPFVFPYEAFAPLDGPGFGERRILDHSLTYTPSLALETNGYVLWYFVTRWFAAGPIGTLFALTGLAITAKYCYSRPRPRLLPIDTIDRTALLLIMAVIPTVILGNLLFWGNYNILATMTDPTNGLISRFGPFYHFDLLIPFSLFTAIALVTLKNSVPNLVSQLYPLSPTQHRALMYGGFAALILLGTITTGLLAASPLERSYETTQHYENAYQPFEETALQNTLIFIPTPYGDWQHHPFQYLRNAPDLNGPTVFALDRGPDNFLVTDAYPNRSYYRYSYRGSWSPRPTTPITPHLEPVSIRTAQTHHAETHIDIPRRVTHAIIRLDSNSGDPSQAIERNLTDHLSIPVRITPANATVTAQQTPLPVPLNATDTVILTITLVQPDGATETYRQALYVRTTGTHVDIIWPPDRYICSLSLDCGNEGRYIPTNNVTATSTFDVQLESRTGP